MRYFLKTVQNIGKYFATTFATILTSTTLFDRMRIQKGSAEAMAAKKLRARAKKLPSGNWRCRAGYTDGEGKHHTKSFTAETRTKAEAAAEDFLNDRVYYSKPGNRTLGELADEFIDNRSAILSPSTIRGYRSIRKNAFKSIINYRISMLTKDLYQQAVNEYAETRSAKSVFSAHVFYNKLLKDNGVFVGEEALLPQKQKKEIKIPKTEEVAKFLQNISGTRLYLYCLFSICLGLRKSETLALQWKKINLQKQVVLINKAMVRDEFGSYVMKDPKTTSGNRVLYLPRVLIDALGPEGKPDDFLITDSPKALESLYNRSRKKYGFNYNFHALRHYYASMMLLNGMPSKYAQEQLGHSTSDMINDVYGHIFEGERDKMVAQLGNKLTAAFSLEKKEHRENKDWAEQRAAMQERSKE